MIRFFLPALVLFFPLLGSCSHDALAEGGWATPRATTSRYFRSTAAGFIFTREAGGPAARYFISLERVTASGPLTLKARFQNPADASSPLAETARCTAGQKTVDIDSAAIRGLRAATSYRIEIDVLDSSGKRLDTHRQLVRCDISN